MTDNKSSVSETNDLVFALENFDRLIREPKPSRDEQDRGPPQRPLIDQGNGAWPRISSHWVPVDYA